LQSERDRRGPDRNHLESKLYQLPKLSERGVIEHDTRSQQVRYWSHERLEEWLRRIEREEEL